MPCDDSDYNSCVPTSDLANSTTDLSPNGQTRCSADGSTGPWTDDDGREWDPE
jgi:hypothetical protein